MAGLTTWIADQWIKTNEAEKTRMNKLYYNLAIKKAFADYVENEKARTLPNVV